MRGNHLSVALRISHPATCSVGAGELEDRRGDIVPLCPQPALPTTACAGHVIRRPQHALSLLSAVFVMAATCLAGCRPPDDPPPANPPVPVRLETVEESTLQPSVHLLGVVEPVDSVAVLTRIAGPIDYPATFPEGLQNGMKVRAGQLLARQRDPHAENRLDVARLSAAAAERELDRHRDSWKQGLESDATLETYKLQAQLAQQERAAAEEQLRLLELKSPVSGVLNVTQRYPPGTDIPAATTLAEVLTTARQVRGWASATDRDRLEIGRPVRIEVSRAERAPILGTLRAVAPQANEGGAFPVLVQTDDQASLPASGEGVELDVLLEKHPRVLTIPEEAVLVSADGTAVFVARQSDGALRAEWRNVILGEQGRGPDGGQRYEVVRGLSREDRVVVAGVSLLSDGVPITAVEPSRNADETPTEEQEQTSRGASE